ncbi:MAG: shikimate kinase [Eubacterium sp.]|nr:shikimate kinase [Eubacterium sp.]
MPTSGKSTVGVILAKLLGMDFVDSDLIIQKKTGKKLAEIIQDEGLDGFMNIEENVCCEIDSQDTVIATGGSVVYSERAMEHFKTIGRIVYLKIDYDTLEERLHHTKQRGVVLRPGQTKKELYDERTVLYEKYADICVSEEGMGIEETVQKLGEMI